ncbi:MAG: hypothetical protein ACOCXT_06840 [Candidatus Dojkabacteria bacterium]
MPNYSDHTEKALARMESDEIEFAREFCEHWGVDRLLGICEFYMQHHDQINTTSSLWASSVVESRKELKDPHREFANMNLNEQISFLTELFYRITLINPAELEEIHLAEYEHNLALNFGNASNLL